MSDSKKLLLLAIEGELPKLRPTNQKLRQRAVRIFSEAFQISESEA